MAASSCINTYDGAGEIDIDKLEQSSIVEDNITIEDDECESCVI